MQNLDMLLSRKKQPKSVGSVRVETQTQVLNLITTNQNCANTVLFTLLINCNFCLAIKIINKKWYN